MDGLLAAPLQYKWIMGGWQIVLTSLHPPLLIFEFGIGSYSNAMHEEKGN
jgi:hypothetical protein